MKKFFILPLLLMIVCALSGCSDDFGSKQSSAPPHQDADGHAEVLLENGKASIVLHPEKWPDLKKVLCVENLHLNEREQGITYQVNGLSGNVKDACIGDLPWFWKANKYKKIRVPVVVFLMEDGSLEWTLVDPYWLVVEKNISHDDMVFSIGKLPGMKNISSLSYERQNGEKGEMTMYATDAEKLRHDLMYSLKLATMLRDNFRCDLSADRYFMNLHLDGLGSASLLKGNESKLDEFYFGSYTIYPVEDGTQGQQVGTITLYLERDMEQSIIDASSPVKIEGSYFVEFDEEGNPRLLLSEGDALYSESGKAMEVYPLYLTQKEGVTLCFSNVSDEELIEHLMYMVPEVKRLVEEQGMSVLVTGETTEFRNNEICRDIWLGTNNEGSFVREILYTITPDGIVFKYDPIYDSWNYV